MTRILLTAFCPFGTWHANSAQLCVKALPPSVFCVAELVTRIYDVDFPSARRELAEDLAAGYDFALHLGQAAGRTAVNLEAIALNVGWSCRAQGGIDSVLEADGPVAYRTELPLGDWVARLQSAGVPAEVSFHAGTYVCNATYYWSRYLADSLRLPTRPLFVHLPLDESQAVGPHVEMPSLPAETSARGVALIVEQLARLHAAI